MLDPLCPTLPVSRLVCSTPIGLGPTFHACYTAWDSRGVGSSMPQGYIGLASFPHAMSLPASHSFCPSNAKHCLIPLCHASFPL
eukprot:1148712-Pelagomonas_calceolata.AAC.4